MRTPLLTIHSAAYRYPVKVTDLAEVMQPELLGWMKQAGQTAGWN